MTTVAWVVITLADLYDYLVAAQVDALNTAAAAEGQTDRFTGTMHDVANRVRNKVKSKLGSLVSATPYAVPPELKWVTCLLTIEALTAAVPGLELDEDQRRRIEDAKADLNRVAEGRDQVSGATDAAETDIQANLLAVVITPSTNRTVTKTTLAGL